MASALNMLASEEANGGNVRLMNLSHTPAETLSKVLSDFHRVKDRVLFSKTENKWEHAETECHEKQIKKKKVLGGITSIYSKNSMMVSKQFRLISIELLLSFM